MTKDHLEGLIFDARYYKDRLARANKRIAKYVNKIDELENKINKLQKDIICMKSHNIYKITTT